MATALTMMTRAARLSGALGKGETLDDDEAANGFEALNTMLESMNLERLMVYYIVEATLTLVAGDATYTIGTGGDIVQAGGPIKIEDACFIRYNNIDSPLQLLNFEGYASIVDKTTQSNIPRYLFLDTQYPLANITFYPVPSSSSAVAHIFYWKHLQRFSALTTALSLPHGYERMIIYNLCLEWACPEFGQIAPPDVQRIAIQSKANIKRINAPAPIMRSEAGVLTRRWPAGDIKWGG